jgi:predicted NAD/FAD-binding protein
LSTSRHSPTSPSRVAVVGGGIAGCAAAWALDRAGVEVELFEARPTLGGNAKTHTWTVGDERVTTGLSVLAWPQGLFRNYARLLETLGVASETVELRFFIRSGADTYVAGEGSLARRHAADLLRWRRLGRLVARFNHVFAGFPRAPSLYRIAPFNPMNYVSLWALARLFGISREFWDELVVPLYSATFLTTRLDRVPALLLPTIDAIVPIDRPARLQTWSADSSVVFEALTAGFTGRVRRSCAIARISTADGQVTLDDEHGRSHCFDAAVLACPAPVIDAALVERRRLHDILLRGIDYCDDDDPTFVRGRVHGDASVIPAADRERILAECCNYIAVLRDGHGRPRYENHFVLSSWIPTARGREATMLVSYDGRPASAGERVIDNRRAHPSTSSANLVRALLYRYLQGRDGLYYCGSYATPGNGHDLSLLSGLVVAEQLGAPYPFAGDREAWGDFCRLRRMMLGRVRRRGRAE